MGNLFQERFKATGNSTTGDKEAFEVVQTLNLKRRELSGSKVLSLYGDGIMAAESFFVYATNPKPDLYKIVTNDAWTLNRLLEGKPREIRQRVITIDDCGGTFPVGGMHCGIHDSVTDICDFGLIDHTYFQLPKYAEEVKINRWDLEEKIALRQHHLAFGQEVLRLIQDLDPHINPEDTTFLICCGNMNLGAKGLLRSRGYLVELERVIDPLQTKLETHHREYVHKLCLEHANPKPETPEKLDLYRDPKVQRAEKDGKDSAIKGNFMRTIARIKRHNLVHLAKTGFDSIRERLEGTDEPSQSDREYEEPIIKIEYHQSGLFDGTPTNQGIIVGNPENHEDSDDDIPFDEENVPF